VFVYATLRDRRRGQPASPGPDPESETAPHCQQDSADLPTTHK